MAKNQEIQITEHTCATHGCGVVFWISEQFEGRRREDHQEFYCPNGHQLIYKGETDKQKLIRITNEKNAEIGRLRRELEQKNRKPRKKRK